MLTALIALTTLASSEALPSSLQCDDLPPLFELFERSHYAIRDLTPEVKKRTVDQFIKELDPSRTLLIDSDVLALKKDITEVWDTMKSGDCSVLDHANDLLVSRSEEDQRIAEKMLDASYKLDDSVELNLDPEKRGYSKTAEERQALVRKMVHFQMSNLLIALPMDQAKKQLIHRYQLFTKRLKERGTKKTMPEMYAEAFATSLDPHSSFFSADALADFQIQMRLALEGIGAALTNQDGFTVIDSLVPGGQAEKSNVLRVKDKIIAVSQDGQKPISTIDMDLQDVVKMIRGKKGTRVTLTVLREGKPAKTFDVTIVRDKIDVKEQAAKITYETRKISDRTVKVGVIDLPSFYGGGEEGQGRSSFQDVKRLLEEAKQEKVDGIVIDLSRNGGGLLQDAVKIAGLFIQKGGVVATKDTSGKVEVLADEDDDVVFSGPVEILTSRASASASEILAGALKDYHRALIVGSDHTFGKGTVQVLQPLPRDLGGMKVTTGMFFLPGGVSTQQKGVASDVHVPSLLDGYDLGEKKLDYSLPPQSTEAFVSKSANTSEALKHWKPLDQSAVAVLARRSEERVQKDPDMGEIAKQLEENVKNRGIVRLSEIRKKEKEDAGKKAHDGKDKASKDSDSKDANDKETNKFKAMQAAFVREGVNILVDMITLGPSTSTAQRVDRTQ
jgi:carboxyl-terminal processing protease